MNQQEKLKLFDRKLDILMAEASAMGVSIFVAHSTFKEGHPAIAVQKHISVDKKSHPAEVARDVSVSLIADIAEEYAQSDDLKKSAGKAAVFADLMQTIMGEDGQCACPNGKPKH